MKNFEVSVSERKNFGTDTKIGRLAKKIPCIIHNDLIFMPYLTLCYFFSIPGEVAQLHSQFKVALDPSHVVLLPNDSIQLQCHLEDPYLPSVPPICVTLCPNYPLDSSPDLHDNAEEYEKSHFLRSVRQALESRVKKLPARHTLTQLLTAWEMGVRSACSFKKRPGSPLVPLVANFSEIATV